MPHLIHYLAEKLLKTMWATFHKDQVLQWLLIPWLQVDRSWAAMWIDSHVYHDHLNIDENNTACDILACDNRIQQANGYYTSPDINFHGDNVGPIRGQQDPGGPHVGHMNFAIWVPFPKPSDQITRWHKGAYVDLKVHNPK